MVVGRDLRADMRITHPLISRAHLLLRFDQGRWLAIDNGSLNGTYVNGRRVPAVDIHDGQTINIGNPDGPQLAFEVGHHAGSGRPAAANRVDAHGPTVSRCAAGAPQPARPSRAATGRPHGSRTVAAVSGRASCTATADVSGRRGPAATGLSDAPTTAAVSATPVAPPNLSPKTQMAPPTSKPPEVGNLATKMIQAILPGVGAPEKPPGSATIGRANDNDIVIQDVLASRHHAFLVQSPLAPKSATPTASTAPSSTACASVRRC